MKNLHRFFLLPLSENSTCNMFNVNFKVCNIIYFLNVCLDQAVSHHF